MRPKAPLRARDALAQLQLDACTADDANAWQRRVAS